MLLEEREYRKLSDYCDKRSNSLKCITDRYYSISENKINKKHSLLQQKKKYGEKPIKFSGVRENFYYTSMLYSAFIEYWYI